MIWLFAVILPLAITAFFYAFYPLYLRNKAQIIALNTYWLDAVIDGGVSLGISLFLALLIRFGYQGYSLSNVAAFFATTSGFLLLVRPSLIYHQAKAHVFFRKDNRLAMLRDFSFLLIWLLELFVFNLRAFATGNYSSSFTFSLLRVAAFAAVFLTFIYLPSYLREKREEGFTRLQAGRRGLLIAALSGLLVFIIVVTVSPEVYLVSYPFPELYTDQGNPFIYYNLFQALMNGQISFVQTPPEALESLNNPYSFAERGNLDYLWDVAYYHGSYYAYQGLAPVLLIMFPVYWLSGCSVVPNGLFILSVCFIAFGFGFVYLSLLLVEFLCPRFDWRSWLFLTISGLFACLWLSLVSYRWTDWKYLIPFAFAVTSGIWFIALVLQGYLRKNHRIWLFGLAAFFYALVLASAPEVGWCGLIGLAPFLAPLFEKDVRWGKKALVYLPSLIVLAICSTLLMVYNAARFGNVFENGRNYLLTSYDPKDLHLTWGGLLSSFFHYGMEPFAFSRTLPFFELSSAQYAFDGWVVDSGTVGVVFQPYFWGMFLSPWAVSSNKNKTIRFFIVACFVSAIMIGYYFYCFYGASIYGMVALWPFVSVGCLATYLDLSEYIMADPGRKWIVPSLTLICFLGIFLSLNYAVNKTDGLQKGGMGLLGKLILQMFSL
jgi:hypothetical protein